MAKKEKNTKNKAMHSKLMDRKKKKLKTAKELTKTRLKEVMRLAESSKEKKLNEKT